MKIKREDFKALIKECLIEILLDGSTTMTNPGRAHLPQKEAVRESTRVALPSRQQEDDLPEGIPTPLKSLFSDSRRRAADKMYQDSIQAEKQGEVLGEMASTWDKMTFGDTPLPSRATDPYSHITRTQSTGPMEVGQDNDYDDGFDPYEAVKAASRSRR